MQIWQLGYRAAVDGIVSSSEYGNNDFGDDLVPGGAGRQGCGRHLYKPPLFDPYRGDLDELMQLVRDTYCRVLQRDAGSSGLAAMVASALMVGGMFAKQMIAGLGRSPEFQHRFVDGYNDAMVVANIYDAILPRLPGPDELLDWAGTLQAVGHLAVVNGLLASEEYTNSFGFDDVPGGGRSGCRTGEPLDSNVQQYRDLARDAYCRVIFRNADTEGLATHVALLFQGTLVKDIISGLAHSPEFENTFVVGKTPEEITEILYDVLLARPADPEGLEDWAETVQSLGYRAVVDGIMNSSEYRNNFGDDLVPGDGRQGCGRHSAI